MQCKSWLDFPTYIHTYIHTYKQSCKGALKLTYSNINFLLTHV